MANFEALRALSLAQTSFFCIVNKKNAPLGLEEGSKWEFVCSRGVLMSFEHVTFQWCVV